MGSIRCRFSLDGTTLASGARDGTVKLWDVATREIVATLEGHADGVNSVSFSLDGAILASGARDGTILLWGRGRMDELGDCRRGK